MSTKHEIVTPEIPCNLCGGRDVEVVGRVDRDRRPMRSVMCRRCGLVWTDPRPNANEMKKYYTESYRREYKQAYEPKLKHIYRAGMIAAGRFREIKEFLRPDSRILDIGASSGEFVYLLRAFGYDARGIEPNRGYGEYARNQLGLPVDIGMAGDFTFESNSFDAVTMHHVFEHLEDPIGVLRVLHPALSEDGIVAIEVPNLTAECSHPIHRFHRAHLYNFDITTLEAMGVAAGFRVVASEASSDGGVIRTILMRSKDPQNVALPDQNAQRIANELSRYTDRKYYLSRHPYVRPISKIKRHRSENAVIRQFTNGRDLLDSIVSSVKGKN